LISVDDYLFAVLLRRSIASGCCPIYTSHFPPYILADVIQHPLSLGFSSGLPSDTRLFVHETLVELDRNECIPA
jgi:hypothetical protein